MYMHIQLNIYHMHITKRGREERRGREGEEEEDIQEVSLKGKK